MRTVLLLAVFVLVAPFLPAKTLYVPAQYASIQAAIDAAVGGDAVVVAPGTYRERIDFKGKAITVRSEAGPERTTLDGGMGGTVVRFVSGEGSRSVLEGFAIIRGSGTWIGAPYYLVCGGGVLCAGSGPVVRNNIIGGNLVLGAGAGIFCHRGATPLIEGNRFAQNAAYNGYGGGVCAHRSVPVIRGNRFENNSATEGGAILISEASQEVTVQDNWIIYNRAEEGGGVFVDGSKVALHNNLVEENRAIADGHALYLEESTVRISFCTFGENSPWLAGNSHRLNDAVALVDNCIFEYDRVLVDTGSRLTVSYSFMRNGKMDVNNQGALSWKSGNQSGDPRLVQGVDGWYYLDQLKSPCLNASNLSISATRLSAMWTDPMLRTDQGMADLGFHGGSFLARFREALQGTEEIEAKKGGTVVVGLTAGAAYAKRGYVLLGGMSGDTPGLMLPGGPLLPLNIDPLLSGLLGLTKTPVGVLDSTGFALTTVTVPANPVLAGSRLYLAYFLYQPMDFASNSFVVELE